MLAKLRLNAADSLARRRLLTELQHSDLPQRLAVLAACESNSYQPATTGVILPTGDHLQIQLREEVSRQIFLYGGYEELLVLAVMRALTPGSVFYDVGAHYGYFSVLASSFVGWQGRVVAFEPGPSAFEKLAINLSGRQNCQAVRKAVWRRTGPLTFYDAGEDQPAFSSVSELRLPSSDQKDSTTAIEVPAISLDDFVRAGGPRPDVIKLDVESAELDAIVGAEDVLATCQPMITVEVGDLPHLAESHVPRSHDILAALVERGYRLYDAQINGLSPHALHDGPYEYDNIVALPSGDGFSRFASLVAQQ